MKNSPELLLNRLDGSACEREVEEELRFHIEMQAQEYERQGLTREESLTMAASRFGNVARIKTQCVRIRKQNSWRTTALKLLFAIAFLVGVLLRVFSSEIHVTQVGNVLIMIAVLGGLLLYGKRTGAAMFSAAGQSTRLGLAEDSTAMPLSFDEKGRSPFERARADGQ